MCRPPQAVVGLAQEVYLEGMVVVGDNLLPALAESEVVVAYLAVMDVCNRSLSTLPDSLGPWSSHRSCTLRYRTAHRTRHHSRKSWGSPTSVCT